MSSSRPQPPRDVLIQSLGGLSDEEKRKLHGPNWALFATQKVRSLREAKKWVWALTITMSLLALALPTTAFYHYYDATESFSILGFMTTIAAACLFAAVQAGWAVFVYMNWRHQLQCYRALQALGQQNGSTDD